MDSTTAPPFGRIERASHKGKFTEAELRAFVSHQKAGTTQPQKAITSDDGTARNWSMRLQNLR